MQKKFFETSEFWLSLVAMLICGTCVVVEVAQGKLDSMGALGVVSAAVALLYSAKRKSVKAKAEADKPKPPTGAGPAAVLLVGLALTTACVVNVPQEVADNAAGIRDSFKDYRSAVAPITTDLAKDVKVRALGATIEKNLELLEELARKGVK